MKAPLKLRVKAEYSYGKHLVLSYHHRQVNGRYIYCNRAIPRDNIPSGYDEWHFEDINHILKFGIPFKENLTGLDKEIDDLETMGYR